MSDGLSCCWCGQGPVSNGIECPGAYCEVEGPANRSVDRTVAPGPQSAAPERSDRGLSGMSGGYIVGEFYIAEA
jgi:hypothetical protein